MTCYWTLDDVGGDSVWETSCGHVFVFNDDGPAANGFQWCGYCGQPLAEMRTSEDAEAEAVPQGERVYTQAELNEACSLAIERTLQNVREGRIEMSKGE